MKSEEVTRILENAIRIGKGVIRYGSVASYIPELAKADKNKLGNLPLHNRRQSI
jgi:Gln_ase: glutaminase A